MLNKAILMGRLTKDPELRMTQGGTATTTFSIAVDRDYVRQGEERKADFINIVAIGPKAEFVNRYFRKGQLIAIEGRIQTRSWDDPQTHQRRYGTEVFAEEVHFAGSKDTSTAAPEDNPPQANNVPDGFESCDIDDDDLPF